ncbi:MAG: DUF58 domain-containing protein [Candidatus Hydrogenedentes bacterium]|nr:DUF58 domain-containing protein [Candidatus Hydrogenedentota bacterium]
MPDPATPATMDMETLSKIGDLDLIARTVVHGMGVGIHTGLLSGTSAEFKQYRPYSQGDDIRWIDWRAYGRSDRLYVKEYQEESNLRAMILLDCSASMDYGTLGWTKFAYARILAAALCLILQHQHDRVGLLNYHHQVIDHIPPKSGPRQSRLIWSALHNVKPAGHTDPGPTLSLLGEILPARGMAILISDLLHPLDAVLRQLRSLRARRHDVMVLSIADPAEIGFTFTRPVTLVDMEHNSEVKVIPEDARDAYLENRRRHFEAIRQSCLESEMTLTEISTETPLPQVLRAVMQHRLHLVRTSSRRGGGG